MRASAGRRQHPDDGSRDGRSAVHASGRRHDHADGQRERRPQGARLLQGEHREAVARTRRQDARDHRPTPTSNARPPRSSRRRRRTAASSARRSNACVHDSVHDRFVALLKEKMAAVRIGDRAEDPRGWRSSAHRRARTSTDGRTRDRCRRDARNRRCDSGRPRLLLPGHAAHRRAAGHGDRAGGNLRPDHARAALRRSTKRSGSRTTISSACRRCSTPSTTAPR